MTAETQSREEIQTSKRFCLIITVYTRLGFSFRRSNGIKWMYGLSLSLSLYGREISQTVMQEPSPTGSICMYRCRVRHECVEV